jgi:hypothetical protein
VAAQTFGPPAEEPLLTVGPVGLTPRLALRDVGVDSNIFNESEAPSRDGVAVFVPELDASMRVGIARLSSRTLTAWNYFQRSASQRSVNVNQYGRVDVELARVSPYGEVGYLRSRHRPTLEIDERVLEKTRTLAAGVRVTLGPRTSLDAGVRQTRVDFSDPANGSALLATRLNRNTDQIALEARVALSALTTITIAGQHRRDRFAFDAVRDTDNLVVTGGVELKPSALVAGVASAGIRRLEARDALTPDHTGIVAAVRVRYILLEQTRFSLQVDRDIEYSFDAEWPYFVGTSALVEVKQAVGFVWDVVVRGGRSHLAFRPFLAAGGSAATAPASRRDQVVTVGLGAGRHLGDNLRVGVDVNRDRRESPLVGRTYSGYRVGGSVTYGY